MDTDLLKTHMNLNSMYLISSHKKKKYNIQKLKYFRFNLML